MLDLYFTRTGFSAHTKKIKEKTAPDIRKLWGMREMGEENKRRIFKALISSKITYPAVPLLCTNVTSMKTLQRIHNKGARFITGISLLERRTSKYVNERAHLKPVNVLLYERALTV